MAGNLQPLDSKFPIADVRSGTPTEYFIKWAQQRQIDITAGITLADVQEFIETFTIQEGTGISITPDGKLTSDPTITADAQAILDQISTTHGAVLFRGASNWEALAPGTAGLFLKTNAAGADPEWAAAGGGGGGGTTAVIRGSAIQASSNSTYNAAFPVASVAGDVAIIFCGHGFQINPPVGWAILDRSEGNNFNGLTIAKILTAGDITAGFVTITTTGGFDGVFAVVVIQGSTMKGLRLPGSFVRSSSGASTATMGATAAVAPDLVILFAGNRGNSTNTIAPGTLLQTVSTGNASGVIESEVTSSILGVTSTATFSVAGSGYYVGGVGVIGA